jgi:cytochrome c oxidase assembly protein subunit 15
MRSSHNPRVHSFAIFTACSTLVLLMAGALVTSNDAGLSVPDWPLSYGSWMPPMIGGIFYEHGHRVIAAFVGCLSIVLAVWLWKADDRRWVRWLGVAALGLVVAQGILGGITVRYFLPPAVSSAHATLAQLFFITVISVAMFTSKWWRSNLLQLFLGAAFRHNAFGIQPHLVGAVVVAVFVVLSSRAVRKRFSLVKDLRRCGKWLNIFFGIQILLGIAAYWVTIAYHHAPQPMPLFVTVTVAHVLGGALTLAASFVLTLTTFRLVRTRGAAVESHPEGARI